MKNILKAIDFLEEAKVHMRAEPDKTYLYIGYALAVLREASERGEMLNSAGKYAVEFAQNHGISVAQAMEQPMIKARFHVFNETGR